MNLKIYIFFFYLSPRNKKNSVCVCVFLNVVKNIFFLPLVVLSDWLVKAFPLSSELRYKFWTYVFCVRVIKMSL